MPAPSTRWPRACWSSGSVAPPGCCATSASSRRRTRRPDGWARRRTRWTRTARSCGRPRSTCRSASVERACASLVGESMQTPPAYSAVKVGGRKLYEAARRGEVLEAPARPIRVDAFDGVSVRRARSGGPDHLLGWDVRAGARRRRRSVPRLRGAPGRPAPDRDRVVAGRGRPPTRRGGALSRSSAPSEHLPGIRLGPEEARAAAHGRPLGPAGIVGPYAVFDPEDALVGIYRDEGAMARPEVILPRR